MLPPGMLVTGLRRVAEAGGGHGGRDHGIRLRGPRLRQRHRCHSRLDSTRSGKTLPQGDDEPGGVAVRINWKKRLGVCGGLTLLCLTVVSGAFASVAGAQVATGTIDI